MPARTSSSQDVATKQRDLWGTERLWHFCHQDHKGAFDMVSIFVVDTGARSLDLPEWRKAWSSLSGAFPTLSQRVRDDDAGVRIEDEVVQAEENVFMGPNLEDEQDIIDHCLHHRQFENVSLTVFGAVRATTKEVTCLAVTNPHALGDAKGIFAIGKALIESIVSQETPVQTSTRSPHQSRISEQHQDLRLGDMFEVAKRGSSSGFPILPKDPLCRAIFEPREWRKVHTFTPLQTDALVQFCKSKSLTVSAWLQASIFHAMVDVLVVEPTRSETAQTFTIAAMPFHRPTSISGATSTIFAPISIQIQPGATMEQTALAVADSFAFARRFSMDVQDEYNKILLKLFTSIS
ncbi:hypothetical protein PHBOTO_006521 [Pseudozyma hubeiensis]|nr:hypothetical protein PHBOTO_006521 [Pseudozyma hubeiensis]